MFQSEHKHKDKFNIHHYYRFAEIEIHHVIENIITANKEMPRARQNAINMIKKTFFYGRSEDTMNAFEDTVIQPSFIPTKAEIALYLAFLGVSMPRAREALGGMSPNIYYALRNNEPFQLEPKFKYWDKAMLEQVMYKKQFYKGVTVDPDLRLYFLGKERGE